MSQQPATFTERLRRFFAPKAQDELDQMAAVIETSAHERDRAEAVFARLRGPGESHRPAWETIAGMDGGQEQPR
jgi:hypothetical protein